MDKAKNILPYQLIKIQSSTRARNNHFALSLMIVGGMHASLANAQREVAADPQTAQPFFDTNPEPMGSNY